jgi:hypothetical protein
LSRYIHKQRIYVDQSPRRLSGTNVRSCSGYLLTAAGDRTSCAWHGFPKILHRATSHIFDSDRHPSATCVGRNNRTSIGQPPSCALEDGHGASSSTQRRRPALKIIDREGLRRPAPHSPHHEIRLRKPPREADSPTRLPPRVQARARRHCGRVEKVAHRSGRPPTGASGGRGVGHAYAGLLFKLATPPRQHRARRRWRRSPRHRWARR